MSSAQEPGAINTLQNDPRTVDLLAAADTAHADSQWWETVRARAVVAISLGATAAALVPGLTLAAVVVGLAVAVLQLAVTAISGRHTTTATRLQEQFDLRVFGLPPAAHTGRAPAREQISGLAKRFWARPESERHNKYDWYVDVTGLPKPYAILICQRENLQWDWPLRRRWALYLICLSLGWLALGVVVALAADWTTRELLVRWWVPSTPAWFLGLSTAYRHLTVAADKQQLAIAIDERLAVLPAVFPTQPRDPTVDSELLAECRAHQDGIFAMRNHAERVPDKIYRKGRDEQEELARTAASDLRLRLLGHAPGDPDPVGE